MAASTSPTSQRSPAVVAVECDESEDEQPSSPIAPLVAEFLQSERGHQLANRAFDLIDSFKKATLDEQAKDKALQGELTRLNLRQTWWLRTVGLLAVVGGIVGLSATGTLTGEAGTILGAVAGYLFAQPSGRRSAA
jgi:hypothetical protein